MFPSWLDEQLTELPKNKSTHLSSKTLTRFCETFPPYQRKILMRRNLHITSDHSSSTTSTKQGTNKSLHNGMDDQPAEFSNNNNFQCESAASSTTTKEFNVFEEEDLRRENAFKAVLVISLCISICIWASLLTIFPVLYQTLYFTTTQFDGMLQFCEETAKTVSSDSTILIESFAQRNHMHGEMDQLGMGMMNRTKNRSFRQVATQYNIQGNADNCRCEPEVGARGSPGRKGMKGTPGVRGAPGIPARLPCEPLQELKKYCPEKCPQGLQGSPGQRGPSGDKGKPGPIGPPGKNGLDGKTGPRGMPGPPGVPGLDGEDGDPGIDAQPTPFIPGPPGPKGEIGIPGPAGPRGLPGIDGPQGPQGRKGAQGDAGKMGTPGLSGSVGPIGEPGEDGHKGVCPTYCATDGGVFFVEPPEWFFKNQKE